MSERNRLFPLVLSAFTSMAVVVVNWMLQQSITGQAALLLSVILLPAVLFYIPFGLLVDKFSKTAVLRWSSFGALAVALALAVADSKVSATGQILLLMALSVVANLHGVARQAILKDLVGVRDLAKGTAWLQIAMMAAAIGGSGLVGTMPSRGATGVVAVLLASLTCLFSFSTPQLKDVDVYQRMGLRYYAGGSFFVRNLRNVWTNKTLRQSVIGLSLFWILTLLLVSVFQDAFGHASGRLPPLPVLFALGGLVIGSLYAARMSSEYIETGLLPLGAIGAGASLVLLGFLAHTPLREVLFFVLGLSGGVFVVPLHALCLYNTRSHNAGSVVATVFFVRGVAASVFLLLGYHSGLHSIGPIQVTFLLLGALTLAGSVYMLLVMPQPLIRQLIKGVFAHLFRLRVHGLSHIPWEGPLLLVGNHVSSVDWALLQMASPRPLRIVMERDSFEKWYVRWLLNHLNVILMNPSDPTEALRDVKQALAEGQAVAVFPEMARSSTGNVNAFRMNIAELVQDSRAVVVPFYIQGLWGTSYSLANARYRESVDASRMRTVVLDFGAPMNAPVDAVLVQRRVQELSIDAWSAYIRTLRPIAQSFVRTARKTGSNALVFSPDGKHFTGTRMLASVLAFARVIAAQTLGQQRVGVLLPPSAAGLICNLAVLAKGKTVVNLNYSAGTTVILDCMSRAGLGTVYTSKLFAQRLEQRGIDMHAISARCHLVYAEDIRSALPNWRLLYDFLRARLLPSWLIEWSDFEKCKLDDVAAIMFSSGSEGVPKGVELTHYNFMGNIKQVFSVLNANHDDVMLGSLPMFHAFGLAVTSFLPVVEGIPVVMQPDPTDAKAVGRLCAEFRVTVMVGTSTFLRMYATSKHVHPLMFRHIRLIFAGAEKLREEVRNLYRSRFQIEIFEGYGTTETTPVASVNIYDTLLGDYSTVQIGNKPGTVGTPLPGSQLRIVDPDTLDELPVGNDGLILIGGAQIMKGYLDDPARTAEAVATLDGKRWYKTGDKGHVDNEGFLTIVDRYSRFAKLGGEMVSLGAIEQKIGDSGFMDGCDFSVVAIPDATKGEKVVMLYSGERDPDEVRLGLRNLGMPPLFLPGQVFQVEAVPKLGTGKADFTAGKALARQLAGA